MNKVRKFQFAEHNRTLNEIKTYYDKVSDALSCTYSTETNNNYYEMFLGMTNDEVAAERMMLTKELSMEGSFELLAYLENRFRTDCYIRCKKRYKDELSKKFQKAYQNAHKIQYKIGLLDVIIDGWKEVLVKDHPHDSNIVNLVNGIKDMFQFRNWMAHGRYWSFPYNIGRHDFDTIWIMVNNVESFFEDKLLTYNNVGG